MTEELKDIRKDLSKKLKKERFEHTIGVMYTASSLAMCYDEDIQKQINTAVSRLEPTLVAVLSILVGIILLSVMLPLMGIMSNIG